MKKLLSLALACTLTLGLASCGGTGTSTSSNAPASSSAVESPAAQFDAASYLSGDYPKLPEDGPAYSLSIGHAMQGKSIAMEKSRSPYIPIPSWAATLK